MKIMYCPQCGGKVRSESIGWRCESCRGFIDMQGGFHPHKEEPFMPPMTYECHEFEECEYNGQPECRLPDGMDCPHGVKGHKPTNADRLRTMDDEQLAKFLCEFRFCDNAFHPCDNCKGEPYCREGHNGMIDWLQKPAGEDTDEH